MKGSNDKIDIIDRLINGGKGISYGFGLLKVGINCLRPLLEMDFRLVALAMDFWEKWFVRQSQMDLEVS